MMRWQAELAGYEVEFDEPTLCGRIDPPIVAIQIHVG